MKFVFDEKKAERSRLWTAGSYGVKGRERPSGDVQSKGAIGTKEITLKMIGYVLFLMEAAYGRMPVDQSGKKRSPWSSHCQGCCVVLMMSKAVSEAATVRKRSRMKQKASNRMEYRISVMEEICMLVTVGVKVRKGCCGRSPPKVVRLGQAALRVNDRGKYIAPCP